MMKYIYQKIIIILLISTSFVYSQKRPTTNDIEIEESSNTLRIPGDGGDNGDGTTLYYRDADGDSWGNPIVTKRAYVRPNGYVSRSGDCDDNNSSVYPKKWYKDNDRDNYGVNNYVMACQPPAGNYVAQGGDCNDNNAQINPGTKWYLDKDLDNYGGSTTFIGCRPPGGSPLNGYYRLLSGDCNDNNPTLHPNSVWYKDSDGDGFASITKTQCIHPGTGYTRTVKPLGDCNDNNKNIHPNTLWYLDNDGDGFASTTKKQCANPGNGYSITVKPLGDCNDNNPAVHPNTIWYADVDNDGFGDQENSIRQCAQPTGYIVDDNDQCPNQYGENQGCLYSPENYVFTRVYQKPMSTTDDIKDREDVIESITYFDGLGRPKQQIAIKASPNDKDITTHISYDDFGRQDKQYLPFEQQQGTAGSYQTVNIDQDINSYYKNKYPDDFPGITDVQDINAYSETIFESSPLSRVLEKGAPGSAWKANPDSDTDHTIKFDQRTNTATDTIAYFTVNFAEDNSEVPILEKIDNYSARQLFVSITKDENWQSSDGNNRTTQEFTDKLGRVILKRTFNNGVAHDTYYVYDDFGNLTFVIPPKVITSDNVSEIELSELCYQYKYDYRNRLIEKKIPGKGWEYIIYNNLDQPVMTQDANMRKENSNEATDQWLFTKYDALGRVAYTGLMTDDRDRNSIQSEINNFTADLWVRTGDAVIIGGVIMYYTNGGYPNVQNAEVLTINYYDNYSALISERSELHNPTTVYSQSVTDDTKSLPTVSKVKVLDTSSWIITATYYDQKGRSIYVSSINEYLDTIDIVKSKLDFTGKVLTSRSRHQKGTRPEIVTVDTFTYDHMGRLLAQRQCIGDDTLPDACIGGTNGSSTEPLVFSTQITDNTNAVSSEVITLKEGFNFLAQNNIAFSAVIGQQEEQEGQGEFIVANTYDELGQLERKTTGNGIQDIDFSYNIRGWLREINDVDALGDDLFAFGINYNTTTENLQADVLYNGNISETIWKTANDTSKRAYGYQYDALNRITSGISNDGNYNLSSVTYDNMGNIMTLARKGHINQDATAFGDMDMLSYAYDSGNKLVQVTDTGNNNYGFKDGSNTNDDFEYDANGNMIIDRNKGISAINYNHLNLPSSVSIANTEGTGNIDYIYTATGAKLKKLVIEGSSLVETEYAGNFVYKNGELQFFNHPEGYVERENDGTYSFVYQYKDHLGNIRLSYADRDKDGVVDVLRNTTDVDGDEDYQNEIKEVKDYYPFGLQHKGYNNTITDREHPYKFGGKEHNQELGLSLYDFGARNYDPVIARWTTIDPVTHFNMSTYTAFDNNPVYFADPSGTTTVSSITEAWNATPENGSSTWNSDGNGGLCDDCPKEGQSRPIYVGHESSAGGIRDSGNKEYYHSGGAGKFGDAAARWYSESEYFELFRTQIREIGQGRASIESLHKYGFTDEVLLSMASWALQAYDYYGGTTPLARGNTDAMGFDSPFFAPGLAMKLINISRTSKYAMYSGHGAADAARAAGFKVLGDHGAAKALNVMTRVMRPYEPGSPSWRMWERMSKVFARSFPRGSRVNVFITKSAHKNSENIWNSIEKMILKENGVTIKYNWVK